MTAGNALEGGDDGEATTGAVAIAEVDNMLYTKFS